MECNAMQWNAMQCNVMHACIIHVLYIYHTCICIIHVSSIYTLYTYIYTAIYTYTQLYNIYIYIYSYIIIYTYKSTGYGIVGFSKHLSKKLTKQDSRLHLAIDGDPSVRGHGLHDPSTLESRHTKKPSTNGVETWRHQSFFLFIYIYIHIYICIYIYILYTMGIYVEYILL